MCSVWVFLQHQVKSQKILSPEIHRLNSNRRELRVMACRLYHLSEASPEVSLGALAVHLIYLQLLSFYEATLPAMMGLPPAQVMPIAVGAAGIFAVGLFLVNAVLTAYNITGTIEGPHDPKFKRWPRSIVASAVASALCGFVAILIVAL